MGYLKVTLTVAGAACILGALAFTMPRVDPGTRSFTPLSSASYGKIGTDPGGIKEGKLQPAPGDELALLSGGCFWGMEDGFRQVPGVVATAVGFTGGHVANPSYEMVCTHTTGHAETVLVEFNPKKISYSQILLYFWKFHDPTTPDRQGPDVGNSYRSAIWAFSPGQVKEATTSKAQEQQRENAPIVTTIAPAKTFYLAEDYHQQYDEKTGTHTCPVRTDH